MEERKLNHDTLGRLHLVTSNTGRSSIFLRAQGFNGTTVATHDDDIIKIINEHESLPNKPLMMLMSNDDPDFNPKSVLNMIYFYRQAFISRFFGFVYLCCKVLCIHLHRTSMDTFNH